MFQVDQHQWEPTLDMIAEIAILITGNCGDSLTQGSMKDTTRGTHPCISTNTFTKQFTSGRTQ